MSEVAIITASELYEATREARKALQEKTDEEVLEEWFEWFKKKGSSYIRDAVKKGKLRVTLELPFQPLFQENGEPNPASYTWRGKSLWKRLTELLPGCKIEYVEEEYEVAEVMFPGYVLEISWKVKKAKKKGFMQEVQEDLVTTVSSTTSVTASSMPSTSTSTSVMPSSSTSADTS